VAKSFITVNPLKVKPAFDPSDKRRMEYEATYIRLMTNARGRVKIVGVHELHHVVPKSLGGSNDKSNIVALTYREHFLAHWLLTKFTYGSERRKMLFALKRMISKCETHHARRITGWQYSTARIAYSLAMLGNRYGRYERTEEHKQGQSQRMLGNRYGSFKHSEERCQRNRRALTGNPRLKAAKLGNKSRPKPVRCITDDTTYPSMKIAAKHYNIRIDHLRKICRGELTDVNGLQFTWL
jgi:hypothetical protein